MKGKQETSELKFTCLLMGEPLHTCGGHLPFTWWTVVKAIKWFFLILTLSRFKVAN